MRKFLWLLLASFCSAGQAADADKAELRHLKEVLWPQAYRENDVALLSNILDQDFVLTSADGSLSNRAMELAELPEGRWPHDHFEFLIDRLDIYHDNTAIIAGEGRATGTGDEGPYCLRYRSSNILIRRDEGWRAVLSHVSGVTRHCDEAR